MSRMLLPNELLKTLKYIGFQVAIDTATPLDDAAGAGGNFMLNPAETFGGYGGPMRTYGRMYGSLDFDDVSLFIRNFIC